MVDIDFIDATVKFRDGDRHALAEYVRTHDLTPEQREFVAKALAGGIAQKDGHTRKPQTEYMVQLYDSNRRHLGYPDAVIYRALGEKFGIDDESVRKNIKRAKARRNKG